MNKEKEFIQLYYNSNSIIRNIIIYDIAGNKYLVYLFYRKPFIRNGICITYDQTITNKIDLKELSEFNK